MRRRWRRRPVFQISQETREQEVQIESPCGGLVGTTAHPIPPAHDRAVEKKQSRGPVVEQEWQRRPVLWHGEPVFEVETCVAAHEERSKADGEHRPRKKAHHLLASK